MKTRIFRVLLVFLFMGVMVAQTAGSSLYVLADQDEEDEKSDEEKELEQKRQDTLAEIDSIKADISTVEKKINELKNTRSNLQTYINQLDRQVNSLAAQISDLEEKIEQKKTEIEEKQQELLEAEAEAEEQYGLMKKRIQYMYEQGSQSFLELLLESESLADMMNRADYAMQMSEYDRQMMNELRKIREAIAEYKAALEAEKEEQEKLLSELEDQKAAVNKAISAKTQEIAAYQSQIDSASGEQSEYQKQLAQQEKLLDQIEAQIAAAAAANAAENDGDGGASGFRWPCPASHRITSYFGPRKAPVPGASTYHKGIDIGAATGSSIIASAAGRVTTSKYSNSAGNYVVISHGKGISTVYMHASALYVSVGDVVAQGQTIAAVGSTGYSSGPHLHFGVIVNGSYVNPLNYVK